MALVVFLRGVNVGGHRTFRPSIVASQLKDWGVVNIGAAGTFVVTKRVSEERLRSELLRRLPFDAQVMICTARELIAAASDHPFIAARSGKDMIQFVSVLAKLPRVVPPVPLCIPEKGRWVLKVLSVHDPFVFGVYRREMKAIRCFGELDKLLGAPGTIRNWNTICSILKVLEEQKLT
jgi:uncharacterized protein (DUF1697 family)